MSVSQLILPGAGKLKGVLGWQRDGELARALEEGHVAWGSEVLPRFAHATGGGGTFYTRSCMYVSPRMKILGQGRGCSGPPIRVQEAGSPCKGSTFLEWPVTHRWT